MVFDVQIEDNPPDRDTAEYICYQTGTDIYYNIEPSSGWTPAWVKLYIKSGGTTIREQSLSTGIGEQTAYWDGKNDSGQWVEPGNYTAEIRVIKSRADCIDSHPITVYKAKLKSIEFTSDHGLLNDNNSDWTDSGTTYSAPEWVADPAKNNPISHTKNANLTGDAIVKIEPYGLTFGLIGDGPNNYVDFDEPGGISTGADQVVTITADANLPDQVDTLTKSIDWTIKLLVPGPDIEVDVGSSGPHKIYVTYGTPTGSVVTEKRISWACEKADGAISPENVADAIHNALGGVDPPREPGECDPCTVSGDWELLAACPYYGECDEQADLMELAVNILGVAGEVKLVMASTNAGEGNCLDYESRTPACSVHGAEKLLLDFYGGGTPANMNQFEACCETASNYYAVWPKLKATNDYTMLQALGSEGVTQHYCWWDYTIDWWRPCNQAGSTPSIP